MTSSSAQRGYRVDVVAGDGIGQEVMPAAIRCVTRDLGGAAGTVEFTNAVLHNLNRDSSRVEGDDA